MMDDLQAGFLFGLIVSFAVVLVAWFEGRSGSRVAMEEEALKRGYGELVQTTGTRQMQFQWKERASE